MMPDPRGFPSFLPRPFAKLTIHFGEPIDRIGSALDTMLDTLRCKHSLNPRGWEKEQELVSAKQPSDVQHEEAPSIPIPLPSTFPSVPTPDPAVMGWAPPPADSRAAQAQQATLDDESAAMEARSRLVEVLRRELAWLGVRSRRLRGEREGEVGRLVHSLVPDESDR